MIDYSLLLLSGGDIPFEAATVVIHAPKIKEIALMGEDGFFTSCGFLNINKNQIEVQDKTLLENKSDFDIFMSIMKDKNSFSKETKLYIYMLFGLLFPEYLIELDNRGLKLTHNETKEESFITNDNFEHFKKLVNEMTCYRALVGGRDYDPKGELAKKIANKIAQGRAKKASLNNSTESVSILSRYVSILAVGENKDMNVLMNYTIYQLFDEFERYQLKTAYDIYIQGKMAGAKGMKEVTNWMDDIHSDKS